MKENAFKNWEIDPEMLYEGYYLAQHAGDASRSPYLLNQSEEVTGISVTGIPAESMNVFIAAGQPAPSSFPSYETSSSYRYFCIIFEGQTVCLTQGTQTSEGNLFIALFHESKSLTLGSNPRIDITLDSGDVLKAYLPPGEQFSEGSWLALWVMEDGSSYWCHTDQAPSGSTSDIADVFDMDAYYASRWHDDNLSRGAFDARLYAAGGAGYEEDADSPAVDAGSKDFLNGGSTSTNCTLATDVFFPNTPDNEPPNKLGEMDNKDSSGDIVPWEDPSSPMYGTVSYTHLRAHET